MTFSPMAELEDIASIPAMKIPVTDCNIAFPATDYLIQFRLLGAAIDGAS